VAFVFIGGERGIRTLDTVLPYTHFPGVLLQPLGHLSNVIRLITKLSFKARKVIPLGLFGQISKESGFSSVHPVDA
jgi:hypothetical protein